MRQQKKEYTDKRSRTTAALRTLLLLLLGLLLGIRLYAWNAESLMGDRLPMPFGYGMSVVLSGSMEPVLSVNDLVLIKETKDITPGDVVVYESGGELVIHRVLIVDGATVTTKGDANSAADEPFDISCVRGKMIAVFPLLGGLARILKTQAGTAALLVAAFFLIDRSYSRGHEEDDGEIEELKAEIRRLKEEKNREAKH